jgi:uncharacterized protein involved in tolerance to divalent cations
MVDIVRLQILQISEKFIKCTFVFPNSHPTWKGQERQNTVFSLIPKTRNESGKYVFKFNKIN